MSGKMIKLIVAIACVIAFVAVAGCIGGERYTSQYTVDQISYEKAGYISQSNYDDHLSGYYDGGYAVVRGKIFQVVYTDNEQKKCVILFTVEGVGDIAIMYDGKDGRISEGNHYIAYVEADGAYTYTTAGRTQRTIPKFIMISYGKRF